MQAITDVAHALGLELQTVDIRLPTDLAPAFAPLRAGGAEAINVLCSAMLFGSREESCKNGRICSPPSLATRARRTVTTSTIYASAPSYSPPLPNSKMKCSGPISMS